MFGNLSRFSLFRFTHLYLSLPWNVPESSSTLYSTRLFVTPLTHPILCVLSKAALQTCQQQRTFPVLASWKGLDVNRLLQITFHVNL